MLPFIIICALLLFLGTALAIFRLVRKHRASASVPIEFLIPGDCAERSAKTKTLAEFQDQISNQHLPIGHRAQLVRRRNRVARELLAGLYEDFTRLGTLTAASKAVLDGFTRQRTLSGLLPGFQFATWRTLANLALLTGARSLWGIEQMQTLIQRRGRNLASLLKELDREVSRQQPSPNRETTSDSRRIV